MVKRHEQNINM